MNYDTFHLSTKKMINNKNYARKYYDETKDKNDAWDAHSTYGGKKNENKHIER